MPSPSSFADSVCTSSAPNKIIIAGEHSVVWGGKALAAPIEVDGARNKVTAKLEPGQKGVMFKGDLGIARREAGVTTGAAQYFPYVDSVSEAVRNNVGMPSGYGLSLTLEFSGAPKGTGNSASIAAAAISAALGVFGRRLTSQQLFDLAMPAENAFHAGKASGIDPRAVCSDGAFEYRKIFGENGKIAYEYSPRAIGIPSGHSLILVDSYKTGNRESTGDLINIFGKSHKALKNPADVSPTDRRRIFSDYDEAVVQIESQLNEDGNARQLGKLFDKVHKMLRDGGVSSDSIETAIGLCQKGGALGAKLSGAGGNGGAVIALVRAEDEKRLLHSIHAAGLGAFRIEFSKYGAKIDQ